MDQVTIPQFIDNEDKILGPITVRQFIIMFVTAVILYLFFKFTDFVTFIFALIPIGGMAGVIAFLKINGQPFHYFLIHILETLKKPSLRVWRKSVSKSALLHVKPASAKSEEEVSTISTILPQRKLSELSLIVDTGGAYMGEHDGGSEIFSEKLKYEV